jgi:hypothetical protein
VKKVTDIVVALVIRSGNESVFVQGKFRAFCNLHGITQETCAPYQHWGNGHAESSFNVTFAAARPMMFTSGFSHTHWPLATSHFVWLQNRLPNKGNAWRIPYDEVFGKLPDLSFVRVFGSQAYAFIDPSLRKKLAPRAKDMLYVGHQEHGSHYMLLDTTNNKVFLTGKPVVRERFDEIGRRLAHDGPTLQELVVFEDAERKRPSPFTVDMPPAFHESAVSLCLLQSSSYFDEEDHETVGIVLVDSGGTAGEIWMAATTYLTASSRPEIAFDMVIQHMRAAARSGNPNDDYPIFTLVQASTGNVGRFRWGQAVVCAADTSCIESSTTTYTVIFHPDVNPADSPLRDCTDREIKWGPDDNPDPLVAMATCSPIERPHTLSQRADPTTYEHALLLPDAEHWIESAMSEMRALKTKEVLEWG